MVVGPTVTLRLVLDELTVGLPDDMVVTVVGMPSGVVKGGERESSRNITMYHRWRSIVTLQPGDSNNTQGI